MIAKNLIKKAIEWGSRRGTAKQHERGLRELARTTHQRVEVKGCPTTPTGCWSRNGRRDTIKVGEQFDSYLVSSSPVTVTAALRSLVTHEACHGLYTGELGKDAAALMKRDKLPFQILNVFEDARIEHLYRTSRPKGLRFRFKWDKLIDGAGHGVAHTVPVDYFQGLAAREVSAFKTIASGARAVKWAGTPTVHAPHAPLWHGKKTHLAVQEFYRMAIAAKNVVELQGIVKMWCDVFGVDRPSGGNGERVGNDINGETCPIDGGGEDDGDSEGGDGGGDDDGHGSDRKRKLKPSKGEDGTGLTAADEKNLEAWFEKGMARHNSGLVAKMVRNIASLRHAAAKVNGEVCTVGNDVYLPNAMLNLADSFLTLSADNGHREITVVVDTSGSMGSVWRNKGGCEFVIALGEVHRRQLVKVNCWLSSGDRRRQFIKLPLERMKAEDFRRLKMGDSEGLGRTLSSPEVQRDVASSTLTAIWTDGEIVDGTTRPVVNKMRRAGADIVGLAPVPSEVDTDSNTQQNMRHYIGKGWVGTPLELTRKLANHILTRAA